jgi:DNA gyrase subunit A
LLVCQGSFGSISNPTPAAPRYTEVGLSNYGLECIISELREAYNSVDWQETYDGSYKEPIFLPAALPNLLINGSFGIAPGLKIQVPKHNISEVIDATIKLIDHPNANILLVPDNQMGCDIIEADFEKISKTGRGSYKVRGVMKECEYKGKPALQIISLPDLVFFDSKGAKESLKDKLEKLVSENQLPQISDIQDASDLDKHGNEIFQVYIVLKKGADPNFVKQCIYNCTDMEKTVSVNFEVIKGERPQLMGYKEYLLNFIEFRKQTKFRMYTNRLQDVKTKAHEMELYIRALESGEIDNIIHMIRNRKGTDRAEVIEFIVNKLDVTPIQAKFLIDTRIEKLSKGYLQKYKEIFSQCQNTMAEYMQKITVPGEIEKEIREELMYFKKKYGCPRRSKIISKSEASGIPEGVFKVVITKQNHIKKMGESENIGSLGGDEAKFVFLADNTDNLILFGSMGKAFKIPVNKVPFGSKGSNGMDIRQLDKYITSGICSVITESALEEISKNNHNFIYTISEFGYIKRMDTKDFLTSAFSGTIFIKLEDGDIVKDVIFMPEKYDLLIYSKNKVLRMHGTEAPYLRRMTRGNRAMDTNYPIDGFSCLYPGATDVVVVTDSGRINKVSISGVPLSSRARAGASIIKLNKTDTIKKILVCKSTNILKITTSKDVQEIPVSEIPEGSSISAGTKMVSNPIKVELE